MTDDRILDSSTKPISAKDLARVIRRISHLFSAGEFGNYVTSEALADLAEFLDRAGEVSVSDLKIERNETKKKTPRIADEKLKSLTLDQVESILCRDDISKSQLVDLGRSRFGMPEARLRRLSTANVLEEVRAAMGHERSLEYIDRNAELSGKSRRS